jgi:hypothetical protein
LPECDRQPLELAQLDDERVVETHGAQEVAVGPHDVRQDRRVERIVLLASHRVAIAEAVELFGIAGEDLTAALDEGFDDRPTRRLDGDRDAVELAEAVRGERVEQSGNAGRGMLDREIGQQLAVGIGDVHVVLVRAPINADVQVKAICHGRLLG